MQKALLALAWRGTAEALRSCAAILAARRAWREAAVGSPPGTLPGPQPAGFAVSGGVLLPRGFPRCPLKSSPLLARLPPLLMVFVPRFRRVVLSGLERVPPSPPGFHGKPVDLTLLFSVLPACTYPRGVHPGTWSDVRPLLKSCRPDRSASAPPPPSFAGSFPTCDFSFSAAFFLTLFQMRGKKLF